MNSQQYEELCRYFLSDKLGINVDQIKSGHMHNPTRPGLPEYKHQIDLYWKTENELIKYLHIVNAKWRGNNKVKKGEVELLQYVKQQVSAHKALMLTTQGFTSGALAVAKDKGIALHIVKLNFDVSILPQSDRSTIQAKLQEIASTSNKPVFLNEVVHKAFDFREISPQSQIPRGVFGAPSYQTKVVSGHGMKVVGGFSNKAGPGGTVTKSGGFGKTK